jgi:GAF domain-containing protein
VNDAAAKVEMLLRQQAAITRFGSFALREPDLTKILTEAARACADGLGVPFSQVWRYRSETNDLLAVAGYGWRDGVIGHVVSRADMSSPQGRAFITGETSICSDLQKRTCCELPRCYAAHGIVSTIDVVIKGNGEQPYGILEINADQPREYDRHDINFLNNFARSWRRPSRPPRGRRRCRPPWSGCGPLSRKRTVCCATRISRTCSFARPRKCKLLVN